jgi:hypothetical protein
VPLALPVRISSDLMLQAALAEPVALNKQH